MVSVIRNWLRTCTTVAAVAALGVAGALRAQEAGSADVDELKSRIDVQQRQIEKLQTMLNALQEKRETSSDVGKDTPTQEDKIRKLAESVFKEKEEKKKKEEEIKKRDEATHGYEVGTDLGMTARWNPEMGLLLETKHKDFTLHVGGRFQDDWVWWEQPGKTRAAQDGAGHGPIFGGVTPFEDGTYFRRVRINLDGVAWDVMEYNLEYAFENFGNNTGIGELDEMYVGMRDMPWIGSVRVGHLRVTQGLEGDSVSSSRDMTFMERASFNDAFYENFAPGVWMGNHVLCDRATYSFMAYRQEAGTISGASNLEPGAPDGAVFMDGNWAYTGRVTALPCFCNEGRELVHLGASCTYRSALLPETAGGGAGASVTGGPRFVDFSARPEMRDTIGNYVNVGPGNSKRLVDTGLIQCDDATVLGTEFLTILGPVYVQAEYAWSWADHVHAITSPITGKLVPFNAGALGFDGGYIQASYFLTGENRLYDRRLGKLQTVGVRPYTPFWFVRDGTGHICTGWGAWELAARYSYLNLNDGPVRGGILGSASLGLNWYLNNNLKIQFEYLNSDRYALPPGAIPGAINSFGIRTQILF